jgi:1,2-diacylglycerol 3-alpha-glucosyltransferase
MRILTAGQAFYKKNNGQAVFTIDLAVGLTQAGHEVLVMAPSEKGRAYRKSGNGLILQTVPTLPMKYNLNITLFSNKRVTQAIAEFKPDVVHIQDHYFLCRNVLHVAHEHNIPVVGTNHFLPDNLSYNFRIPAWARMSIHRLLWKDMLSVFNTLQVVTTPTETAAGILRQQQIKAPVQAISCGVDQTRFRPRPELDRIALRQRYGLEANKILFLYVGRVDREKGLDVLIQAIDSLQRDDIRLAIVGKGSGLNDLQNLTQSLSLGKRVVFLGYVPGHDLPCLLNSADIFAMPSQAELQSIATLEAMASGLPILAANARALPELVEHQVNGYLFEGGNAIEAARGIAALADNRDQWAAMGQASLLKVRPHSLSNTIQRYINLYQSLLLQPKTVRSRFNTSSAPANRAPAQQVTFGPKERPSLPNYSIESSRQEVSR